MIDKKYFNFLKMFVEDSEGYHVDEIDFKILGKAIHDSEIRREEARRKAAATSPFAKEWAEGVDVSKKIEAGLTKKRI